MMREWADGTVAMIRTVSGERDRAVRRGGVWHFLDHESYAIGAYVEDVSPLVVIDPEDREQVERLLVAQVGVTAGCPDALTISEAQVDRMQAALREFANPTPPVYRTHKGAMAPWPAVSECHSSRRADHECPQCSWEHEHDWVAWNPAGGVAGVPVRCSKCGGRKCDRDDCAERRHSHMHEPEDVTA